MRSVTGAWPARRPSRRGAHPAGAAGPANHVGPADPADHAESAGPADHAGSADSTESAGPGEPAHAITPADPAGPAPGRARLLTWLAMAGIGCSILIMIAASAVRDSWMYPPIMLPGVGPPWDLTGLHMSTGVAIAALWTALLIGALGVIAGLGAVQRGARPSVRMLLIAAAVTVVLLTVLPPAGSTDAFDYAAYGRIVTARSQPVRDDSATCCARRTTPSPTRCRRHGRSSTASTGRSARSSSFLRPSSAAPPPPGSPSG